MYIRRIGRSKEPTTDQLRRLTSNLSSKLKTLASVEMSLDHFSSGDTSEKYSIYEGVSCKYYTFATWPECLDKYFELMKNGVVK